MRSTLTDKMSRLEVSNSIQAPLYGMSLAAARGRPVLGSESVVKYTPGDLTNWLTTTRSAPLMMNVPVEVIIGMSPINRVCSLISPCPGPPALIFN